MYCMTNQSIKLKLFHSSYYYYSFTLQILHPTVIGWLMSCDCILIISLVQTVEKLPHALHMCHHKDACVAPHVSSHMDTFTTMESNGYQH